MAAGRFIKVLRDGQFVWERRTMAGFLDRPGYIYGLSGDNGLVKLGCSDNVRRRMKTIRFDLPSLGVSVELLGAVAVDDMGFDERLLHWQFREFNSHSEWFHIDPKFLAEYLMEWHARRIILASRMPDNFYLRGWHWRRAN